MDSKTWVKLRDNCPAKDGSCCDLLSTEFEYQECKMQKACPFVYWIEVMKTQTEHSPDCEMVKHGYSDCTCGFDDK